MNAIGLVRRTDFRKIQPLAIKKGHFDFITSLFFKWCEKPNRLKQVRQIGFHVITSFSYVIDCVAKLMQRTLPAPSIALPGLTAGGQTFQKEGYFAKTSDTMNLPLPHVESSQRPLAAAFKDLPLEMIAIHLDLPSLYTFAKVSQQTALATSAQEIWEPWAIRFSLELSSQDIQKTMQFLLRYLIVDNSNELMLKKNFDADIVKKCLEIYPEACWLMQTGSSAQSFHFSFRSLSGKVIIQRDIALGCVLSERFINASRIINDERYRQIKVYRAPPIS